MAKNKKTYELVKYNYTPNKEKKYSKEEIVDLYGDGIPYFSLEELDMDTCEYSLQSLVDHFRKDPNEKIGFAVKVSKKGSVYYLPALFDAPYMKDILSKLKTNTIDTISGKRTVKQVPRASLVQDIWQEIKTWIERKNMSALKSVFGNSNFSYRLYSFMQNDYTNSIDKMTDLYSIYQEFLNYEVFRKALIKMKDGKAKRLVANLKMNTKKFQGNNSFDKYYLAQVEANDYNTKSDDHEGFLSPLERWQMENDHSKRSK